MALVDLISYYQNLLIAQFQGKPNAVAHVGALVGAGLFPQWTQEQIALSDIPASGTFQLTYLTLNTTTLNWNSTAAQIQNALNLITGLGSVVVQGSLATKNLKFVMVGVTPQASDVTMTSNTLKNGAAASITATTSYLNSGDANLTLPQAIQNAFTLGTVSGANAIGPRLDSIGKYVGVTRYGYNFTGPMTLNDNQFTILILIAIIKNSATSDFSSIQNLIHQFFNGIIQVWDHQDMRMSYYFDSTIGTQQLAEFFVQGGFLPKPMGVQLATVTYAPNIATKKFLGFRTYMLPLYNASGVNTYSAYSLTKPWKSYSYGVT